MLPGHRQSLAAQERARTVDRVAASIWAAGLATALEMPLTWTGTCELADDAGQGLYGHGEAQDAVMMARALARAAIDGFRIPDGLESASIRMLDAGGLASGGPPAMLTRALNAMIDETLA